MIEVTQNAGDFIRYIWRFVVIVGGSDEVVLKVAHYACQKRKTKRHRWENEGVFNTYDKRSNTIQTEYVPLPADVVQEAKDKLNPRVEVW